MEWLLRHFYSYGIVFQAVAIIHFIRRRPENYWLWVILLGGGLGALVYIGVEVVPDLGLMRGAFQVFPRRKRIKELEAMVLDNPAAGNYEELADLYLEDKKFARARECYNRAISTRTDSPDPFYRRAICALELGDYAAAREDLERAVNFNPKYDFQRAAGLLAHALGKTGETERAGKLFEEVTRTSTLSETQYNYACFLAAQGRQSEAHDWAQRVLSKKPTMPGYLRRRERPWFRKAAALLKQIPAPKPASSA
jgi:hypothetical protein